MLLRSSPFLRFSCDNRCLRRLSSLATRLQRLLVNPLLRAARVGGFHRQRGALDDSGAVCPPRASQSENDDEAADRLKATYGANFPRLVLTKAKYDPTNLLSVNQNIMPATAGPA